MSVTEKEAADAVMSYVSFVRSELDGLEALVSDPQPGLITWVKAVCDRVDRIGLASCPAGVKL